METCGGLGTWGLRASCDYVCAGKTCGGQCKPGAARCSSATELETCDAAGEWGTLTACEYACVNAACGGVCTPGSKRCGAMGATVETCTAAGEWQAQACSGACTDGACSTCTPGETECVSSVQLRTCGATGEWGAASQCANACFGNACVGVCKPAARECVAGALSPQYHICSLDGQWSTPTKCDPKPACSGGNCVDNPKVVFVTSTLYTGNLGGLSGADAKCQERASAAGLSGTFRAYLSDTTGSPSTRFNQQVGPYRRVDGVVVAQSYKALTSGALLNLLNLTEKGGTPPVAKPGAMLANPCGAETSNLVWSNTTFSGALGSAETSCANWTTTNGGKVAFGRWDVLDHWSNYCAATGGETTRCASQAPIYCFEQ
jgi:hypothetical protein